MGQFLAFNGKILPNEQPLVCADNRGLRYGDGLFETMKYVKGEILLGDYHFERLFDGLRQLQFTLPAHFTPASILSDIRTLCSKNKENIARVRLAVIRGNGGLYDPENHFPQTIIQTWALPDENYLLNENGLVMGIYPHARKSTDVFSTIKTNNYLPYCMAALYATAQHWNDALVLNTAGNICDATIANLFIIKNKKLYTPSLSQGCVSGVMRRYILSNIASTGYTAEETILQKKDILEADEVFLTNAIWGMRWVQAVEEKRYGNLECMRLFQALFKK
jgi:branched-chain amino acid aminotransferase